MASGLYAMIASGDMHFASGIYNRTNFIACHLYLWMPLELTAFPILWATAD